MRATDEQGIPYEADDRENAYYHWAHTYEKNLAATSRGLNIAHRTLTFWKAKYHWDEQYLQETTTIADLVMGYAWNELKLGVSAVVSQLIADATNKHLTHSDRIQSQKLLFNLLGMNKPTFDQPTNLSLIDARTITTDPSLSTSQNSTAPLQLSTLQATKSIEANLAAAMTQQVSSRKGINK